MTVPDHFNSPLGIARCDKCKRTWPCHLSAWGNPQARSKCIACHEGLVTWSMDEPCDA